MHHTGPAGNRCSCISDKHHGFRGEGDLSCRFAVGDRNDPNTPGYSSAEKEGNLLFPANFTSIRCGFSDYPSLAEGDRIGTDGDRSLAEGNRIATDSSGCRGPTGADMRHELPAQQIL